MNTRDLSERKPIDRLLFYVNVKGIMHYIIIKTNVEGTLQKQEMLIKKNVLNYNTLNY